MLNLVTTTDLVSKIANASADAEEKVTKKQVKVVLDLLKTVVEKTLSEGDRVRLNGFMSFNPTYRAPRKGNNVATGEAMSIPETVVVSCKAGSVLREAVKAVDVRAFKEATAK